MNQLRIQCNFVEGDYIYLKSYNGKLTLGVSEEHEKSFVLLNQEKAELLKNFLESYIKGEFY